MVQNVRIFSNLMVFHLRDMQDWNSLRNSRFRIVSAKFDLLECLREVYEMMRVKSYLKKLKLEFKFESKLPV